MEEELIEKIYSLQLFFREQHEINREREINAISPYSMAINKHIRRPKALKAMATLYNFSFASAQRIYYHKNKYLFVYDDYLEKHGIMLPQEQVRGQVPLPQGP